MENISQSEWQSLPEQAQQEVLDFFEFLKRKYAQTDQAGSDTQAFSNHSAQQVEDWQQPEEDAIWK